MKSRYFIFVSALFVLFFQINVFAEILPGYVGFVDGQSFIYKYYYSKSGINEYYVPVMFVPNGSSGGFNIITSVTSATGNKRGIDYEVEVESKEGGTYSVLNTTGISFGATNIPVVRNFRVVALGNPKSEVKVTLSLAILTGDGKLSSDKSVSVVIYPTIDEPEVTPEPDPDPGEPSGFEGVLDWLIHIIIPHDDFFQNEFNKLNDKLKEKLPFQIYIDTIGRLKEIPDTYNDDPTVLDFEFDYMGTPIKFGIGSMIAPYLPQIRMIITGLYVLLIAKYNYRQIMHLIRGTNYANMNTGAGGAASTEEEIHL